MVEQGNESVTEQPAAFSLDNLLTQLGAYVQSVANGNKNIIDSASMPVKGTAVRTTVPPPAPDPLSDVTGPKSGEAKLKWASAAGAKSYVVERTLDPNDTGSWKHVGAVSKRTYIAQNVPAGRTWFRVAAISGKGQGPWSDPATCTVT